MTWQEEGVLEEAAASPDLWRIRILTLEGDCGIIIGPPCGAYMRAVATVRWQLTARHDGVGRLM